MTKLQLAEKPEMTMPQDHLKILREAYGKGLTNTEFETFVAVAQRTGLDPFRRQIYALKYGNTMSLLTGIDGLRALAARTGRYAGQDDAVFDNEEQPRKATVTVWMMVQGTRCPFTATARWAEYCPSRPSPMWKKMPCTMLAKCAEALALRKACPEETSDLYIKEEMDQAQSYPPHQSAVAIPTQKELPRSDTSEEQVVYDQEELEQGYQRNMDEEEPPLPFDDSPPLQSIEARQVRIMGELVGKGKKFGSKVQDAKKWCKDQFGAEPLDLTEEQVAKAEKELGIV